MQCHSIFRKQNSLIWADKPQDLQRETTCGLFAIKDEAWPCHRFCCSCYEHEREPFTKHSTEAPSKWTTFWNASTFRFPWRRRLFTWRSLCVAIFFSWDTHQSLFFQSLIRISFFLIFFPTHARWPYTVHVKLDCTVCILYKDKCNASISEYHLRTRRLKIVYRAASSLDYKLPTRWREKHTLKHRHTHTHNKE